MSSMLHLAFFCFLIVFTSSLKMKSQQNWGSEHVVNGNFNSDNSGWISDDIEVNRGNVYNGSWASGPVSELDAYRGNTRLTQKFNLKEGQKCKFELDYAAREGVSMDSNKFSLWFNNNLLETVTPSNYQVLNKAVFVTAKEGENIIGVQGEGPQDTLGMTVDNISFRCEPAPVVNVITPKPGQELIINGSFEEDQKGWTSSDFEVLPGGTYNNQWSTGKVNEIDAWKGNSRISQIFNLDKVYELVLNYDYAARQGVPLPSNSFKVTFNGQVLEETTPADYNKTHKTFKLNSKAGNNEIVFEGTGASDGLGMTFDNISIMVPVPDPEWEEGHEYIINGTFDDPDTHKGWIATDYEVLPGTVYNGANVTGNVNELDAWAGNTKITQKFRVSTIGQYKLEFDTAARNGVAFESNGLKVHFNGKEIFSYVPTDYNRHHHVFDVEGVAGENVIVFEGTGTSEGLGITLDNVSLKGHKVEIEVPPTPTPDPVPVPVPTDECS